MHPLRFRIRNVELGCQMSATSWGEMLNTLSTGLLSGSKEILPEYLSVYMCR